VVRTLQGLVAALALAALVPAAQAATVTAAAASAPGARAAGMRLTTSGTITALDATQRTVVIKNAQGVERSYRVEPSVNLEQVKVGDTVQLDYFVALAVTLRKGGAGIREKVEAEAERKAPPEGRPGIEAARRTTIVADVISVNRSKQTVRLKGPEGRVVDLKVNDKAALKNVKAGDQVVAVLYEALAVGVKPSH